MNCNRWGCGKELTEVSREEMPNRNAVSGNKIEKITYQCPDGHKFTEKVEVEGTSNKT